MNRSSLFFVLISALLIGGLVGISVQAPEQPSTTLVAVDSASSPDGQDSTSLNYRFIDPNEVVIQFDEFGGSLPVATGENISVAGKPMKQETVSVELALNGAVEYKVEMQQGDSIVYRWSVEEGEVYYDFHGHPLTEETQFFTRYSEDERSDDSGSIVAAYEGQHGWFWLNESDHPITIELEVAGFYDRMVAIPIR